MNKKYLSILILLSFVLTFFNLNSSYAARKPDVVSHDAELLQDAISFNVEWQSEYPVVLVRIAAGNKTKKIELDEYDDNVRDSYGYYGEASLVFEIGEIGIFDEYVTYVIQLEDDLGRRSRRVTGKVKVPETLIGGRRDRQDDKMVDEYVDKSPSQKPVGVIDRVLDVMARHDTPPNIKHLKVNKYGKEGVSISSEAIDDKGLRNITIRILDQSGNIAGEEILSDLGKIWKGTSKTFSLKPGVYTAVAQAVDTGGNTSKERSEQFLIEAAGETDEQKFGALIVTIAPEVVFSAGAQWKVDGGEWKDSGTTVSDLSAGKHTIEFKDIAAWAKPGNQEIEIKESQTSEAIGTYTQDFGALVVAIDPKAAISAGAQWKVDGGEWQNSGVRVSGLSAGAYDIEFKDIAGFIKPSTKSISIQEGQTTTDTASYSIESLKTGSLNVIINPQEVNTRGAKWSIDGTNWHEAGKKIDIAVGPYTVKFSEVEGWETPVHQRVEIKEKDITPAQGNYKKPTVAQLPPPAPAVDNPPRVKSFSTSATRITQGQPLTFSFAVSDDKDLKQVELWRADDTSGKDFREIKKMSVSGQRYSGSFSDTPPSAGTYRYGLHVVDTAGKWNCERNSQTGSLPGVYGPIKVNVPPPAPAVDNPPRVTSGADAGYLNELSRFNDSLVASKKYTSVGIVMMNDNQRDRNTIIALFGSKVAKMASGAGSAAADLLKPANWIKLYSQGAVRYFFQDNKNIMIDVSLVALTLENQGRIGFVIAHTSSWGVDSYKVYALVDNYQFTRVDASGPEFVRREGTLKKLIGDFWWQSMPASFRNKIP